MNLWSLIALIASWIVLVISIPIPDNYPFQSSYNFPGQLPYYPNYVSYPGNLGQALNSLYNPNQIILGGQWLPGTEPRQTRTGVVGAFDTLGAAFANIGNTGGAMLNTAGSGIFNAAGTLLSGVLGSGAINTGFFNYLNRPPWWPFVPPYNPVQNTNTGVIPPQVPPVNVSQIPPVTVPQIPPVNIPPVQTVPVTAPPATVPQNPPVTVPPATTPIGNGQLVPLGNT